MARSPLSWMVHSQHPIAMVSSMSLPWVPPHFIWKIKSRLEGANDLTERTPAFQQRHKDVTECINLR